MNNRRPPRTAQASGRVVQTPSNEGQTPFSEFFLGESLVPGRQCGDCVACCELLQIDHPALHKPSGVLCPHCRGNGCGIYEDRPSVCQTWYCVWRRIGALPEETRPDKLGVMFEICTPSAPRNMLTTRYIRGFSLGTIDNFAQPVVQSVIDMFRQAPMPVWLDHAAQMICVHPSREIYDILVNGNTPLSDAAKTQADMWRDIYEPLWLAAK